MNHRSAKCSLNSPRGARSVISISLERGATTIARAAELISSALSPDKTAAP